MVAELVLPPLASALNHYLHLDPHLSDKLPPIANKLIRIHLTDWDITFYLHIESTRIALIDNTCEPIDATMRGNTRAFLQSLYQHLVLAQPENGQLTIEGDTAVVRDLTRVLQTLDIDWEEQLARVFGDVIAHKAGNIGRLAFNRLQHTQQSLQQNLTEYLQEEKRLLPCGRELNDFFSDVDSLRDDVERVALHFEKLGVPAL
jgi:ubiquinone biosynthesis protein UbiJ